jgi:hypothetical protein
MTGQEENVIDRLSAALLLADRNVSSPGQDH